MAVQCDECGTESDVDERVPGWRAFIRRPNSSGKPLRVVVHCPECASAEAAAMLRVARVLFD